MRPLLTVMAILTAIFASTFIIGRLAGVLTEENVRTTLAAADAASLWWLAAIVVALLFVDLFIAVPTLTITILAGYFMGFPAGFAAALVGTGSAAAAGYALARRYGERIIARIVKDPAKRAEMAAAFQAHGPGMILLSRAAPMIPEVTACMAGATRMHPARYALLFLASTVPYVGIASYAGSISTLDDPKPAIFAAIGLYAALWIGWLWFRRRMKRDDALRAA